MSSPSVSVSPIAIGAVVRDADHVAGVGLVGDRAVLAKKNCGALSEIDLPVRTCLTFMPRVSLPEHSRANAMRSRWFGSMLAWILNTKADMLFSSARPCACRPSAPAAAAHAADGVEQIADAEVLQRRAEEHRRQDGPRGKRRQIERLAGVANEIDLRANGAASRLD
jgi:hypothetical protein